MIVLDSSVLVGIIKGEADAEQLLGLLASEECAIGAPTLVETRAWCSINLTARSSSWLEHLVDSGRGIIVPFSREMADVASSAFDRFGRAKGHPARLNFGDCMAPMPSLQSSGRPLLFKGGDSGHTDVMAHSASIRT